MLALQAVVAHRRGKDRSMNPALASPGPPKAVWPRVGRESREPSGQPQSLRRREPLCSAL